MRVLAATAAAMTAVLPLTVTPPHAWSAGDCQIAFQKWARLSSARVQTVAQGASGPGACLPSEAARRSLLDALARTRRLCGDTTTGPDTQQTRTLLNINQSFIASLDICRSDSADAQPGWVTRAAPSPPPAKPRVATPEPPPRLQPKPQPKPPPKMQAAPQPAPPTGGPRPAVIARPSPPPPEKKAKAAAPPPKPPCLVVSSAEAGRYAFVNQRCRGHAVIAVIETRNPYGKVACKGYEITSSLALRAAGNTAPRLNYECVASRRRCNKERLGNMFPECDW